MTWTQADRAFRRWSIHVVCCRVCRTDDTRCERGKRLRAVWLEARRTATRTPGGTP